MGNVENWCFTEKKSLLYLNSPVSFLIIRKPILKFEELWFHINFDNIKMHFKFKMAEINKTMLSKLHLAWRGRDKEDQQRYFLIYKTKDI